MRFGDLQMVKHGQCVGVEMLVGVNVRRRRHVGGCVAARGIGDTAMPAREIPHLRLPVGVVGRKFMQEDDGSPAPGFLEIEADVVACDGIGHFKFLLIGPALKIAVNTFGCNEAKSVPFRREMTVERPQIVIALPHKILLSPYPNAQNATGCWSFETDQWELGVSTRVKLERGLSKYGSVVCVSPVASCCCAGFLFGGDLRIGHSGFSKVSSRRRAARSCASCWPSHGAALRTSLSSSAPGTRIALGARRGANASARFCRYQCQHCD